MSADLIVLISILSLVIFFITFIHTDTALIILIVSMLFSPELRAGDIPGRVVVLRIDDILLFVIFFGWMAKMAVNKEIGLLRKTYLNRPILIYIAISLVATFLGALRGDLRINQSFFFLLKYTEYFLVFFMVINNIKNIRQAKMFVFFLLLTCFFIGIYSWAHMGGIAERVSAPFEGKEGGEPNTLSGYLLLMMALILGFILHPSSKKMRILFSGLFVFTFIPFVMTLSRGGWLGFFPMFFTFIILCKKHRAQLIVVLIVVGSLLPFVSPDRVKARVMETFAADKTYTVMGKHISLAESAAARVDSWKVGYNRWMRNPVLGNGIPAGVVIDNQYTRVLAETGILGFLAFLWIIRTLFAYSWRLYNIRVDNEFVRAVSLGFFAGLVGLLVHACSAATFILIRVMEPFWFLAAIVAVLADIANPSTKELNHS